MSAAFSRILGLRSDAGPLDLLGVSLSECTAARIESALERQLERVDQHPESDTPEADELRLALHTAAAQLLDPTVRSLLIRQAAEAAPAPLEAPEPIEPVPAPQSPARSTPAETYFEPFHAPPPPRRQPTPNPDHTLKRVLIVGGIFVVLALCALVGALIALTPSRARGTSVATTSTAPPAGSTPQASTSATPAPPQASAAPIASPEPLPPGRSPFKDPGGVIRQLRVAVDKARPDPAGAVKDLESIVPLIADWWPKYDPAQRRAADDALVEFIFAAASASPDAGTAAVRLVSAHASLPPGDTVVDPDAVWPAAWGAGILARLAGERELPTPVTAAVRDGLNRAVGIGRTLGSTRFDAGAAASLSLMPTRLIAPALAADEAGQAAVIESFKRWADAISAGIPDPVAAETVLMDGLERVLVDGPEPDTSAAAFAAAELAASRIRWRPAGPARIRLLAWFNDGRISASDLRVVTGAIAGKSAAEGIEPTMVLSIGASTDDRSLLRARYASAWRLAKPEGRGRVLSAWRAAASSAPAAADSKLAPLDAAIELAIQARVNQAARTLFLGDADAAESLLNALPQTRTLVSTAGDPAAAPGPAIILPGPGSPNAPRSPSRGPNAPTPAPASESLSAADGQWAAAYLKAEQNIPVRLERLSSLAAYSGPLSRLDAAVLAEAACFASPGQVRYAAQQQAARFTDDPALVRAMLDMLPSAPRIFSVTALYQRVAKTTLPKQGDAEWELAARRALVERLLQMTAVQGEQSVINASSAIVAEAYVSMSMSAGAQRPTDPDAERAVRAAAALYTLWSVDAQRLPAPASPPLTLEQIQRRQSSRDKTASGPAQAFAARQIAVAELLGYIVAAERPLDVPKVAQIMSDLARSRRDSGHVLTQMLATERAMTRLWLLRFAESDQASGAQTP